MGKGAGIGRGADDVMTDGPGGVVTEAGGAVMGAAGGIYAVGGGIEVGGAKANVGGRYMEVAVGSAATAG